jgi:PAS domain S-box-containing protein
LRPDGSSCLPYASEAIRDIYRVTPEDVREDASAVFANIHPEDYDGVVASTQQSAATLQPWQYEFRVRFADGTVRWLLGDSVPNKEKDGSIIWHGFITDITERKLVEERIHESESRFRTMANAAPVFIWVAGVDKSITWVNQMWLDFTGSSFEQELGYGWTKHIHPSDYTQCLDTFTRHFDQREEIRMEYRMQRHDGEFRWVADHGVPLIDGQGHFSGYIGSCIDVTAAKELTIELRQTLKDLGTQTLRLQTLLKTASDGIHILDTVGNIVQFSDSFAHMLGYRPQN